VSGSWEPVPLGLLISGVLVGCGCYFKPVKVVVGRRSRKLALTPSLLLAVLLILGLVNFLAVRYPVRVDFTETQLPCTSIAAKPVKV